MGIIVAKDKSTLFIGRQGEKRRTKVLFEFDDIASEFPGGTLTLMHTPPGSEDPYPVQEIEIDYNSSTALWTIMDYDTACEGQGECQLIYVQGTVAKSKVWKTSTDRSITVTSASTPEWQQMVNSLLEAHNELIQAIANAQETIDEDLEASQIAKQGAEDAQEAAETAKNSVDETKGLIDQTKEAVDETKEAIDQIKESIDQTKESIDNTAEKVEENASAAEHDALKAEGYAVGTQDGVPAGSGQPYFHDNAKYYKEAAETAKEDAVSAKNRAEQVVNGIEAAGNVQVQRVANEGGNQVTAVQNKGQEVLNSIPEDYSVLSGDVTQLKNALQETAQESTGQELLAVLVVETLVTESLLEVAGNIIDHLPQDESGTDIRDALALEADRLSAIYDLWYAEKEGA